MDAQKDRMAQTISDLSDALAERDATIARLTAELEAARAGWEDQKKRHHGCWLTYVKTLYRALDAEARLPRAYEAGRDDAAVTAFNAISDFPLRTMLTNTDNATVLELRIRALAPPADLADRVKGGEV